MKQRRLLAAALTLILTFALAAPSSVFAANDGTITINDPTNSSVTVNGKTFYAYQLFELESYSGTNYAYRPGDNFVSFNYFASDGKEYRMTSGGDGYISDYLQTITDNSAEINDFANKLREYIYEEAVSPDHTKVGAGGKVEFTDLPLGYYMVFSEGDFGGGLVAAHVLTTTDPDASGTVKADLPTLEKKVSDTEGTGYDDYDEQADQNIGSKVYFMLKSYVPNMDGYADYIYTVHDTLSSGLDFDDTSVKVYIGGNDTSFGSEYNSANYAVNIPGTGGATFDIVFDPYEFIKLNTTSKGWNIYITYSATLNEDALIVDSGPGNTNTAKLEYSNDPYSDGTGETTPDVVNVYTFEFDIYKYTGELDEITELPLENAEFELRTDYVPDTAKWFVFDVSDEIYRVVVDDDVPNATKTLTSDSDGNIRIEGLDAGEYHLIETKAPDGYNELTGLIDINIVPTYSNGELVSYTVKVPDEDSYPDWIPVADGRTVNVLNNTGIKFPESGGIGRTIFTIGGLVLMLGAALVLIARRKTAQR